ncbi:MAG: 2-keto-4-pentenoate hydratase [Alphaproteobacteria bacterium]
MTEAEAYDIQDVLHRRLADAGFGSVAGYKIGCTTPVMQRFIGIRQPCAGAILAETVRHGEGRYELGDYRRPGVECEIAVVLGSPLGPEDAPYDRRTTGDAVAAVAAAIELVDDRYDDFRAFDAPTLIADDFFGAGCVLAPRVEDWRALDLARLEGEMRVNGRSLGTGVGADVLGHPLEALVWLANMQAARGRTMPAGAIVLLGSLVQTYWIEGPGDHVEVAIDGLGRARALFN